MTSVDHHPSRSYAGQTGDERAARRRDALVDAAFALVAEAGWRALSIEAACRRAGLNKRYFYESFDGRDALTAAVTTRLADEAIAATLGALDAAADAPRDEATRRAIGALVVHLTDDPRRARVLFGAVPAGDAAAGHHATAIRRLISMVAVRGRDIYALADDPVVGLSAAILVGGTSQAVLDWLDGRVRCSRDDLVDDLVALWHAIGDAATARVRERVG
jgi:AcrR family transcriptional regulator